MAANVFAIAVALASGMQLAEMMLLYWVQSVIIGITSAIRIRSVQGSLMQKSDLEARSVLQSQLRAFILWYGTPHGLYLWMLLRLYPDLAEQTATTVGFWISAVAFAANHAYSLRANLSQDRLGVPSSGMLQMLPFARVVPMHITFVLGASVAKGTAALVLFCALKAVVDVAMHLVEHFMLRMRRAP